MKRFIFILAILTSTGGLFAQKSAPQKVHPHFYQQGEWMLIISPGGSWFIRNELMGGGLHLPDLRLNTRLKAGRFIKNKWLVGGDFHYEGWPFFRFPHASVKAGILSRYYLSKRKLSSFFETNGGYHNQAMTMPNCFNCPPYRVPGWYLGARLGLVYRFGKIGFETSWGVERKWYQNLSILYAWQAGLQAAINLYLG